MTAQLRRIGNRSESRLRVRLPARLMTLDFSACVTLCDLSQHGAKIERPDLPTKHCDVLLKWLEYEAFGRIKWGRTSECGIRFYDPIPMRWLVATRDRAEVEGLPDRRELDRRYAQAWVKGQIRL
jgi:PilZ domain